MARMIEKKSAMKAFFYFMFIDGQIDDAEKARFEEIGYEILPNDYETIKDEIAAECNELIKGIDDESEAYDVVQEAIDASLSNTVEEAGIGSRLLMWNFFAIAIADNDHSENENRMINHIARTLQIDKSIVLEMKQLVATINKLEQELKTLEDSTEPYREVRPVVVEVEKRLETVIQAGKELILDEDMFRYEKSEEYDGNGGIINKAGKAVVDGIGFVGSGAASIMSGIGGLFGKKNKAPSSEKNEANAEPTEKTDDNSASADEENKED